MTKPPYRIVALQLDQVESRLVGQIFNRKEFQIEIFDNSRDFIQYMRMQPAPDCFVSDLETKDIDGIELVEKIRKNQRWGKVPIVILANSVDKAKFVILTKLKINGYIVKPYQPKRLFEDVLRAMGLEVVTQKKAVKRVKANPKKVDGEAKS